MLHPRPTLRRAAIGGLSALLAIALAIAPSALPAAAASSSGRQWAGRTIQLGAIFSTTGIGISYGPEQIKGARLAVAQINAAGGVKGAKVRLTVLNDDSDPATSATRMRTLATDDKVLAVLGPTFSNSAASADPIADQLRTPVLAVSNTGPGIVGTCAYPCSWIFRDSLGEAVMLPAGVDAYVASAHPARASVIYPDADAYGASSGQIAAQALTAAGVQVVGSVVVTDPTQPEGPVGDALAGNPTVVVVTASSAVVDGEIIKGLRAQGFAGQILGGNAFNSPVAGTTAGTASQGARSAAGWFLGSTTKANRAFVAAYKARYGTAPDQFSALAYTGVRLLADAAGAARLGFRSVAADRAKLKSSLAAVKAVTPQGLFQFTADHDPVQPIWLVAMDGHGGYQLVKVLPRTVSRRDAITAPTTGS
ncbi:MAG TPA: ABC transporter substrate-binding protein [Acidimicrobiales bacterium]|jgi:branched-chain amino acid transport system substrate-binding protein|nr:ABC transporter substrate-binding protein [Acidimicrobiales bacterium]